MNKEENLLTRLQNVNLCFHFEVEQQVNGVFLNFFGFNGTAGVWRIKALEESGGWLERTTVEDMDIAVRAHLNGWKFIYLNDVKVILDYSFSVSANTGPHTFAFYLYEMLLQLHLSKYHIRIMHAICMFRQNPNEFKGRKRRCFKPYSHATFRYYAKCLSPMKLTESSSIVGILVLCSYSDYAFQRL